MFFGYVYLDPVLFVLSIKCDVIAIWWVQQVFNFPVSGSCSCSSPQRSSRPTSNKPTQVFHLVLD